MRDCEAFMEQISALLDGELGEYETDVLMAHLDTCPECRMFYDAFMSVSDNIKSYDTAAPEGFSASVMRLVEKDCVSRKRKNPLRLFLRVASLAACLALIVFTVSLFRGGGMTGGSAGSGSLSAAPAEIPEGGTYERAVTEDETQYDGAPNAGLGMGATAGSAGETLFSPEGGGAEPEEAKDSSYNVAMMGEIRPLDASEAREFVDSVASIRKAVFYLAGDLETPVLAIEDGETMAALAALLEWAEKPGEFDTTLAPAMTIEATADGGGEYLITLWVYEGKLYCGTGTDGESPRVYVAGGTLDDLLALIS